MSRSTLSLGFALAAMTYAAPSYGELIAYEGFDYANAGESLFGKAGGTGFASEWMPIRNQWGLADTHTYRVTEGSLSFGGIATSGNRIMPRRSLGGILGRALADPVRAEDTRTVYFSFLVQPEEVSGHDRWFVASLVGGDSENIYMNSRNTVAIGAGTQGVYNIGNFGGSLNHLTDVAWNEGETALLVVRADLMPGVDILTLHVNPAPGSPEPVTGTVKQDMDLEDLGAIVLSSTAAYSIDELRLGDTFGDVVPLGLVPVLEAGDADQDLDFDQFDLVQVQQAAKYLTTQPATWGEGDWDGAPGGEPGNPPDGNGLFDNLDIVAALQTGNYLTGAYAALSVEGDGLAAVPEPSTFLLAAFAVAGLLLQASRQKKCLS